MILQIYIYIYITTLIDITSIYQVFHLTKYIQEEMSYDSLPQRIKNRFHL